MGEMPPDAQTQTSIADAMAEALPTHEQGDTTSDISSSLDVITLLVHACMVKSQFILWSTNEDPNIRGMSLPFSIHTLILTLLPVQTPNARVSVPVSRNDGMTTPS